MECGIFSHNDLQQDFEMYEIRVDVKRQKQESAVLDT